PSFPVKGFSKDFFSRSFQEIGKKRKLAGPIVLEEKASSYRYLLPFPAKSFSRIQGTEHHQENEDEEPLGPAAPASARCHRFAAHPGARFCFQRRRKCPCRQVLRASHRQSQRPAEAHLPLRRSIPHHVLL